jgi:Domain of unknown function (DUF4419)
VTQTFPVSEIAANTKAMPFLDHDAAVRSLLQGQVEALELDDTRLILCTTAHPFAEAAHTAFYEHYPLVIGPDDVWFCIVQGFAQHVTQHTERLREHFVKHEGKHKLIVTRPDFVIGEANPWLEVFNEFSEQIAAHVGPIRDVIVPRFSTTRAVHRAASQIALMESFQGYFEYELVGGCGIPQITLLGTPEDWRTVRFGAQAFAKYDLEHWTKVLDPVLEQLELAANGQVNLEFWQSFFRYESASGGSEMTGWILVLFPYLRDYAQDRDGNALKPNPYLQSWTEGLSNARSRDEWINRHNLQGPYLGQIPSGLASAPVKIMDLHQDQEHESRFVAGMMGVAQDPLDLALRASFGWAVIHER